MEYETQEYKGYTIKVMYDDSPLNPRTEWDNLGVMICVHRRYDLGNIQEHSAEAIDEHIKEQEIAVILPLYLMDHSGLSISTGPFNDPWDSGQVGYIYLTRKTVEREWGWARLTQARKNQLRKYLIAEVEMYDAYLTGQVYGFEVFNSTGGSVDSCWGFYGQDGLKDMINECHATIDNEVQEDAVKAEAFERMGECAV
jgi:hypothetical protein